ncbi:hypothetical protein B296_00046835 [Ensete ventricosum]|uniref:Uncharacterized protein n=1 Tax=Ensete ventricosum TaxID=4639 RepID=A0A426XJR1_ENSVE|nr:hypothetical protein B296_00046835 [Ensete ventricosum]
MTIRFGQSQVHGLVQGSDGAVGNSLGVRRKLSEGIRSLLGWHKRVRQKKIETCRKIAEGSRKACRELGRHGPKIKLRHRAKDWMMRWELAERFAKENGKLATNTSGDCRRKTVRLATGDSEVNIKFKPKFEKWREPLLRVNR